MFNDISLLITTEADDCVLTESDLPDPSCKDDSAKLHGEEHVKKIYRTVVMDNEVTHKSGVWPMKIQENSIHSHEISIKLYLIPIDTKPLLFTVEDNMY